MKTLTVRKLRQLLFEVKNQEANVGMFTEDNRECLPLVMIQDDSEDCGLVSLGFFKESEEARKKRLLEAYSDRKFGRKKVEEQIVTSRFGMRNESHESMVNRGCRGNDL